MEHSNYSPNSWFVASEACLTFVSSSVGVFVSLTPRGNPHLRLALRICSPWALLSLSGLFGIYCMDGSRMSLILGTENEMSEFGDERWGANLEHAYRLQGSTMSCASRVPGSSPLTRLQQPDKKLKEDKGCIYFTCLTLRILSAELKL